MITVQFYKYGLRNRRLIIQEKVDLNIVANQLKVTKIQSVISFFIIDQKKKKANGPAP